MLSKGASNTQWNILHGLLKDAIYGGRIDDLQDDLKLETYLKQFFSNENFHLDSKQPTQKLCKAFNLPRSNDIEAYVTLINDMPDVDNVTWMGLPANIDRAQQMNDSKTVLAQISTLMRPDSHSQLYNKDQWSQILVPFVQIWKKLMTGNDLLQKTIQLSNSNDPIVSFFELESYNAVLLLQKMNADLNSLSKVLRGTAMLTNEVQSIAQSILRDETPMHWLQCWEGPERAQAYLESVSAKAIGVFDYLEKANSGSFLTSTCNLARIFNPVSLLNALRQYTSRKLQIPMDSLKLIAVWEKSVSSVSLQIDGMWVQGCRCDGSRFMEVDANDAIFNAIPQYHMCWVPKDQKCNGFQVPIYSDPSREKRITSLLVPFQQSQIPWILAGVAFFVHQ
jgi:dynein heavy chain 2